MYRLKKFISGFNIALSLVLAAACGSLLFEEADSTYVWIILYLIGTAGILFDYRKLLNKQRAAEEDMETDEEYLSRMQDIERRTEEERMRKKREEELREQDEAEAALRARLQKSRNVKTKEEMLDELSIDELQELLQNRLSQDQKQQNG